MVRRVVFWTTAILLLLVSAGVTLADPYDYFEVIDPGVRKYLTLMEGAHIATVPGWISKGQVQNAVGDLEYTLKSFPNHPQALQFVSMVSQLTKNQTWAVKCFERAVSTYPQHGLTHAQYGLYLVSIGNVDDGIDKLKHSVEIEPKLSAGYAGLAQAYTKKGDFEQAREAAKKARELGFSGKLPAGL